MKRTDLPIRLRDIFDTATDGLELKGRRFIDVGSDHGLLSVFALLNGFDRAVCTDSHEDPSERTRRCLRDEGFEDRSEVYCTDGVKGVPLKPGDIVVMAGLGGNNMCDILTEAKKDNLSSVMREVVFCFQPQKSIEVLRQFLADEGFFIDDEDVTVDRGIFYPIIRAVYTGEKYDITLEDKYYGTILRRRYLDSEPAVLEYYSRLDTRYKIRARGDEEIKRLVEEMGL